MKVLIGGGTGFLGRNLQKALLNRGHAVELISRNPGKGCITWKDLEREHKLPECEAVVNLSGEYILNLFRFWNESYKKDIYCSRIGTNHLLVKLMSEASSKPSVWVSAHAEGYYPRSETTEYDANFLLNEPKNYGQKLCKDWEESALLPQKENIRHVGVRIGVVLGKDGGLIQQAWWPFWFGLGGTIGSGTQILPWIHVRDVTNLFVHAIENENVNGFLNAVSPGICSITEFKNAFGEALNRPTLLPVPEFVIKFGIGADRAPFMLEGSRIIPKRTAESGFKFAFTDINNAMKDIVTSK